MRSFRNEYDGHTIEKTLEQTQRMTGKQVDKLAGDRGYRGIKQIGKTKEKKHFQNIPN